MKYMNSIPVLPVTSDFDTIPNSETCDNCGINFLYYYSNVKFTSINSIPYVICPRCKHMVSLSNNSDDQYKMI